MILSEFLHAARFAGLAIAIARLAESVLPTGTDGDSYATTTALAGGGQHRGLRPLEFHYKTKSSVGNIMQKGQSDTTGGQIKVQLPNGTPQCLFKGANGVRVGTGAPVRNLSDGTYHTVKCVHTATRVTEFIDGVQVSYHNGSTGPINNARAFVVGGKTSCDQIKTTCDYYSGDIDWIKISHG